MSSSSFTFLPQQENGKRSSQFPISNNTLEVTTEISTKSKHTLRKGESFVEIWLDREKKTKELNLRTIIDLNLYNKYERTIQNTYNINVANDLVLNSSSHIVATFKDYLVYDDLAGNLKQYYNSIQSSQILHQLVNSKPKNIIPNYSVIEENKFIFKNLKKKAKKRAVTETNNKNNSTIFTKGLLDELVKRTTNIPVRNLNKLTMIDLIDKFIDRDTLSLINNTNCTNVKVPFAISVPITKFKPPGQKHNPGKIVPLPNPLRKGVGRLSPISRSKAKVRHVSQECVKDSAKMKSENQRNSGRMTAIGHYPVKQSSKKVLGETKQAKVASAKLIKSKDKIKSVESGKMRITKVCIASALSLNSIKNKAAKATKESPNKASEVSKKNVPKENITIKISTTKNIKPLQAQHENHLNGNTVASKLSSIRTNNDKKPSKKSPLLISTKQQRLGVVITPKSNNGGKVVFPVSGKVETNIRAVSALGNNYRKRA